MAAIYDHMTGDTITAGLQGCYTCDEALRAAECIADDLGKPVVLEDDDGTWLVHPVGGDGSREDADPIPGEA